MAATKDMVAIVHERLKELGMQQSLEPLKQLFWTDLNYERANKPLSYRNWPKTIQDTLYVDGTNDGSLFLLATGGRENDFDIIYIHLASEELYLGYERPIVMKLLQDHSDSLFIFSTAKLDKWHFINVKHDSKSAKRPMFRRITVGPEERLRTASERLAMLDLANREQAPLLEVRNEHEKAFDVEAVTKGFFDQYKILYEILQKDLSKQTQDLSWAHDYALQFLNRCMFLYFIQRKGWLGNDREFLRTFWQSYNHSTHEKDTFFEKWLKVLFFEAFNKKFHGGHTHFPPDIQNILALAPYLNGGLFTENELDRGYSFTITDERFSQIFAFLQSYNFTIAEDSPLDQEVAVDPEMIGKVYESLVNVSTEINERGDAGIFYTPRTEIDLMCRLALVDYLANQLGQGYKETLYKVVFAMEPHEQSKAEDILTALNLWDRLKNVLEEITVVDPACGSGSFLVSMLYILDDLQDRVNQHGYDRENPYTRKKRIIGRSLYGVDVMEWAVRVAELRLWLTLIVDADTYPDADTATMETRHAREDPLLPHLSFKVRCGDSLVQEVGGINLGRMETTKGLPPELKNLLNKLKSDKQDYYHNYTSRHPKSKQALEWEEFQLFGAILQHRIHTKQEEQKKHLRTIEVLEGERSLLNGEPTRTKKTEAEIALQRKLIAEKELECKHYQQALESLKSPKNVPFVWEIAFAELFGEEKDRGFDIVIGNPPYVRQEQIFDPRLPRNVATTKESKQLYKTKLARSVYLAFPDFFRYNELKDTAAHKIDLKSDLYIYFYLYGLKLCNPQGTFCFITSNSWLDVGYGADLQEFLLKYCYIKMILDNQVKRSFAAADVNTVITLFSAPSEKPDEEKLNHIARFVMFKVTFEHILSADIFRQIEQTQERTATREYRVYPITQKKLLEEGLKLPEESVNEVTLSEITEKVAVSSLVKEAQATYMSNKWGGKYLRAPDIYWTILDKGKGKLVRLGDIAEVRFGIKTGANEFFFLDKAKIREWRIEEEFLRPTVQSPRECKSILIDLNALKFKVFMCHKTKEELNGTTALKYIEWGESQGFDQRQSCKGRARWWDLGEHRSPYLGFNYLIDSTAKTFYVPNGCYFSDNFHEVNISFQFALPLCASLNSTLFQLMVNVAGRSNFGGGLLKIQTYEVSDLLCIHPEALLITSDEMFSSTSWDVRFPSLDRRNLDTIIFDELNLTQGEREAVYEAVIELVEARLEKATSLSSSGSIKPKTAKKRLEAVNNTLGIWVGLPEEEVEVDNTYA